MLQPEYAPLLAETVAARLAHEPNGIVDQVLLRFGLRYSGSPRPGQYRSRCPPVLRYAGDRARARNV